jgi:hypothetical protein
MYYLHTSTRNHSCTVDHTCAKRGSNELHAAEERASRWYKPCMIYDTSASMCACVVMQRHDGRCSGYEYEDVVLGRENGISLSWMGPCWMASLTYPLHILQRSMPHRILPANNDEDYLKPLHSARLSDEALSSSASSSQCHSQRSLMHAIGVTVQCCQR